MLILMIGAGIYFTVRAVNSVRASLAQLPHSNADWIWY